jgi:hypothetical protein
MMNNIRVNILTYLIEEHHVQAALLQLVKSAHWLYPRTAILTEEHHVQAALLQLVKSAHWLYPRTAIRTKAHGGVERSFLVWRLVRWEMVVLTVQRKRCCRSRWLCCWSSRLLCEVTGSKTTHGGWSWRIWCWGGDWPWWGAAGVE